MADARCASPGCGNDPTRFTWGWADLPGVHGWALLYWCDGHFAAEPALRRAERTGHRHRRAAA
jgi:hypothetical protein